MKTKRFNWRSQLCIMHYALCILMVSTLTMSCSDDDDKNTSEQRNEDADPLDTDEAETAWRWLSVLTSTEALTNDWAKKTYEPTVGVPSENNANTRIVVVGTLDEAKTKFASLAGVSTDQLGGDFTVSQSGVGKLAWTPSKAGAQNLAEVIVDTKLIPKLQKIVYCTHDQIGQNGLFSDNVRGTAYYRLGDVVMDEDGYYWVCVRPSFAPDKGKSHWMNIFNASQTGRNAVTKANVPMPEGNIYNKYNNVTKYNNRTILLPTQLKYSREHMNNLSNLIFALADPIEFYAKKVGTEDNKHDNGLCGFDYKYHGENFLRNVASFWDRPTANGYTVWQILFNRTRAEMETTKFLHFYYKGYRWRIGRSGYLWEYTAQKSDQFQVKPTDSEDDNMVETNFGTDGFDIRRMCSDPEAQNSNVENQPEQFQDDTWGTWVVRYKTGQELMKRGDYSPYEELNGCTNIYRYNEVTGTQAHADLVTEDKVESLGVLMTPVVGCLVGKDGKFYANKKAANALGVKPEAMVVYLGGNMRVEHGKNYNGLAIALQDLNNGTKYKFCEQEVKGKVCSDNAPSMDYVANRYTGLAQTEQLKNATHSHPAATAAWGAPIANGFSNWFIPSTGQWALAMEGMGFGKYVNTGKIVLGDYKYAFDHEADGKWLWEQAGIPEAGLNGSYMTTTEHYNVWGQKTYYWNFYPSGLYDGNGYPDDNIGYPVRQFIAFRYGNGGTQDFEEPWAAIANPVKKGAIGQDGLFYKSPYDAFAATGTHPAGYILLVGEQGTVKVDGKNYRGMAMTMFDGNHAYRCAWTTITDTLVKYSNYMPEETRKAKGFSNCFVPSVEQWKAALKQSYDLTFNDQNTVIEEKAGDAYGKLFEDFAYNGFRYISFRGSYWTSTEDNDAAYYISIPKNNPIKFVQEKKDKKGAIVHPFFAF